MATPTRKIIAAQADTIVVKVGTRVLTHPTGELDLQRVAHLAEQLAIIMASGRQVVLVSSGAVGAGLGRLQLAHRPTGLAELQAVASVGQSCLIEAYNRALEPHGRHAAQILLTTDDFNQRRRYLNVRNTLSALFTLGAVPIVNENDAVRVDELQRNFGDNDRLAAMVSNLLRAPLLVLLSDVDGVYDTTSLASDTPTVLPEIDLSEKNTSDLVSDRWSGAAGTSTGPELSRGGMRSKLEAARLVVEVGDRVIIANGRRKGVLTDILTGREVGTLLVGTTSTVNSRKRWISSAARCTGRLVIDEGAALAIRERGSSLLAVGITSVEGDFGKGDVVALADSAGNELARGLSNYTAAEARKIAGQPTDQFTTLLGHLPYVEVIHRDNLVLRS